MKLEPLLVVRARIVVAEFGKPHVTSLRGRPSARVTPRLREAVLLAMIRGITGTGPEGRTG